MAYNRDDEHKAKMSEILKAKRAEVVDIDEPDPNEDVLSAYIDEVGARSIGHMKTKRPALYAWVVRNTSHLPKDSKLTERAYILIHGDSGVCENGNRKTFGTYDVGYKSACGRKEVCACAREQQSASLKGRFVKEKKIPEKRVVDHKAVMKHARDSFKAKTGYDNAFQDPSVKKKISETMISKYGVSHPAKMGDHREKIAKTSRERYGVDHWTKNKDWAATSGEKSSRRALGDELYELLESKEKLSELNMSAREISQKYDVSYSVVQRKMSEHGLIGSYQSSEEIAVDKFVKSLGFETETRRRMLDIGKRKGEIDIFIPEMKLAIEYCGLYWHSEWAGGKNKSYHLDKLRACRDKGIRLITIFSDEWLGKREICESRIRNALGVNIKGRGARSYLVDDTASWGDVSDFLNKHHIQGSGQPAKIRYALRDESGSIVAVMTFGPARRSLGRTDGDPELLRFCTDGRSIPGAASRLFSSFVTDHSPNGVVSYCDLRWGTGGLYEALGFINAGETGPNYWYTTDYLLRDHRYKYTKHKLIEMGGDPKLTEIENAKLFNLDRIWDCGNVKYIWTPDHN